MTDATFSPEFAALQRAVAGRYSLVREIGRGGMGVVFLARDVALDRPVAIKLLPPDLARDPAFRDRFLQEARMAASLAHPNIVPIHSVESHDEVVFFVMTYVDGESLGERVRRRGPLGVGDATRIIQEVSWALSHAHARGVAHRDVKPDNILLDRESGRAMVTDFGIARNLSSEPSTSAPAGTPHYLSPEQLRGEPGDARSDQYALGVTAWHALTGDLPFDAPNLTALIVRQSAERAPSLSAVAPHVPARLVKAIDRCLDRVPSQRWPSAEELAVELNAIRARSGELPAPVRAWAREVIPAGNDVGLGLGGVAASLSLWVFLEALTGGDMFMTTTGGEGIMLAIDSIIIRVIMIISALLFGGLALGRLGSVVVTTRDLKEAGYDHDSARLALVESDAERAMDVAAEPRSDRRRRALAYGLVGGAASAGAIWLTSMESPWVYVPSLVSSVLLVMLTAKGVLGQLIEGPSPWSRLLRGRFGRSLFRAAGWFTRKRSKRAAAAQPTIAALGIEAEELFRALPAHVRDQLHDLPAVLDALREQAERLRAGDNVSDRLSGVVAAMEAVRLDLMGMGAGVASVPDVTRNLEDARRLSERVEIALRALNQDTRPHAAGDLHEFKTPV